MKFLLKEDADIFLEYENVEAQPIPQVTPNKFLHICRIIYDSWKEHFTDDTWYQYDDNDSDDVVYCHFKMMGTDETAWHGKEDLMDSYIYGSLARPEYYVGGYHFEEIKFGGPEQELRSVDMENGSCIITLSAELDFNRTDSYSEKLVEIVLAYNACVKNGYYVELCNRKQIVAYIKEIYAVGINKKKGI